MITSFAAESDALPSNFSGTYKILQSRLLALTSSGVYVLQDGAVIALEAIDFSRAYCYANQSKFDEPSGSIDVSFVTAVDGTEHALLKTVPGTAAANPTSLECVSSKGFIGTLDLSIAFGRVVELTK